MRLLRNFPGREQCREDHTHGRRRVFNLRILGLVNGHGNQIDEPGTGVSLEVARSGSNMIRIEELRLIFSLRMVHLTQFAMPGAVIFVACYDKQLLHSGSNK